MANFVRQLWWIASCTKVSCARDFKDRQIKKNSSKFLVIGPILSYILILEGNITFLGELHKIPHKNAFS